MKFIANILTNRKFNDCEFYNVVSKKEDLIENIPTLVIGWSFTKELYPDANIITWEIDNNTYWMFNNRERGQKYDEMLKKFRELVIKKFIKSIHYKFFNILTEDYKENNTSLDFMLENCDNLKIYINNDIVYATCECINQDESWVYGFSLRDYDYLGIDRKKIFNKIYKSGAKIIDNKDTVSWSIRDSLKNHIYVIPCLF